MFRDVVITYKSYPSDVESYENFPASLCDVVDIYPQIVLYLLCDDDRIVSSFCCRCLWYLVLHDTIDDVHEIHFVGGDIFESFVDGRLYSLI